MESSKSPETNTPPATRREIFGWAMFDFANSSFTTIVVSVVFSVYFTTVVVSSASADWYWSVGITISNIIVVVLSPLLGAVADDTGRKKQFLFVTYILCVIGTAMLFFVAPGMIFYGLVLFIIANTAFALGENLAGAFLPEISTPENIGRVSGFAWGLGYVGGLGCLLLLNFTVLPDRYTAATARPIQVAMLITAAFFLFSAIPTFALLKERAPRGPRRAPFEYITIAFSRLALTIRSLEHFSELARFLAIFFVYSCGLMTVIAFAAIFAAKTLGFTQGELVLLFLIVQISAAGGALGFGVVQDKLGARTTIQISLVLWILVCVISFLTFSKPVFFVVVLLAGLGIGSLQSASRGLVGLFSPREKSAEFFGFWGLAGKGAYAAGPAVFGLISALVASAEGPWNFWGRVNQRVAMLSTALFFVVGLIGMFFVSEKRGLDAARSWESK